MYYIVEQPLPQDVRTELKRIAAIGTSPLKLACVWAVKTMAVLASTLGAIFVVVGGLNYLIYDTFGMLSLCRPRSDIWSDVYFIGWATGIAGAAAAGISRIKWRDLVEAARLAQLDLSSGRCEHCELTISERHQIVDDDVESLLFVPYDQASTVVFRFSIDHDARLMLLTGAANWRANWSWMRTRNFCGAWDFKLSGLPVQVNNAVDYDSTNLDELWRTLPQYSHYCDDRPQDGDLIRVPFETILSFAASKVQVPELGFYANAARCGKRECARCCQALARYAMMISDHVVFSSPVFAVEPDEDEETNPRIYGRALAAWVAAKLSERGVSVERIVAEDFGRCVMVRSKPFMLWIACANLDGDATRWQMYVTLERGLIGRLFGRDDGQAELDRLREHFHAIVQNIPGASAIEWQ